MMDGVKSVPVCLAVCKREMRREGRISSGCTISTIVDKEFFHRPASTPPPSSWSCPDLVGEATWRPVNSDARRLENSRQMWSVWRMVVVEKEPL